MFFFRKNHLELKNVILTLLDNICMDWIDTTDIVRQYSRYKTDDHKSILKSLCLQYTD